MSRPRWRRPLPGPAGAAATPRLGGRAQAELLGQRLVDRALAEGRLHPDDVAGRARILELARSNHSTAERHVAGLAPLMTRQQLDMAAQCGLTPAQWLRSNRPMPEEALGLTAQQLQMARDCGLTPAEWRAHNPSKK